MFTVPDATDHKLRELIGKRTTRRLRAPLPKSSTGVQIVEPVGMTPAEEAEIKMLIELADPRLDGDERAAIKRLTTALAEVAPE